MSLLPDPCAARIEKGKDMQHQGTFNCAVLETEIGGGGDTRREREREGGREKSVAFVYKMI